MIFDATTFGAKGDGVADDTAAIQAAIDASTGTADPSTSVRGAKGPVYVPSGQYRITSPLRIASVDGFVFHGDGACTRLVPSGTLGAVIDINGAAYSTFRDFRIAGNIDSHAVTDAIHYRWDPATAARSTMANAFERIVIQDTRCVTAFRVGNAGSGVQCDQTSYRSLCLEGRWSPGESSWWQEAMHVGDGVFGNNLCHWVYSLLHGHWATGVNCDASNLSVTGASSSNNGTDFRANTLSFFALGGGIRSEGSARLLETMGPSTNVAHYSISDVIWWPDQVAPDLEFIRMTAGGVLTLRNVVVPGMAKVRIATGSTIPQTICITGLDTPGTLADVFTPLSPITTVTGAGYYQSGHAGYVGGTPGFGTSGPIKWPIAGKDGGALWPKARHLYYQSNDGTSARPVV